MIGAPRWLWGMRVVVMRNSLLVVFAGLFAGSVAPAAAQSRDASSQFWSQFGDSTLTKLIKEAQRANTDVSIAQARLAIARASRRLASFDLVPTITATGSSTR